MTKSAGAKKADNGKNTAKNDKPEIFSGESLVSRGFFLYGDKARAEKEAVKKSAEVLGCAESELFSNPDFWSVRKATFGIDDARAVRELSSKKSFGGRGRVFLIQSDVVTEEANNALLKTFEEPQGACFFFFVSQNRSGILPTLRSRMAIIDFSASRTLSSEKEKEAADFFRLDSETRLEKTARFLYDDSDGKKNSFALEFVESLEWVASRGFSAMPAKDAVFIVEEIERAKRLLSGTGAAQKMIIEHLCLVLPRIEI
jgi:hypothetical protein